MNGGSRGWKGGGGEACTQLDQRGGQKPDNRRVQVGQRKDDWSECGFCSRSFRKPLGGLGGGPVGEDNRTGTQGSQIAEQRLNWGPLGEFAESLRQHQAPEMFGDVRRARQRHDISAPGVQCDKPWAPVTYPAFALRDLGGWEGRGGGCWQGPHCMDRPCAQSWLIPRGGVHADEANPCP